MSPATWGILTIVLGAIIYKLSPNPADDEVMHSIAYASYRNRLIRYGIYLSGILPPLLGIVGVILGFFSSWKMGLLYLIIAVILWIALSPTIRLGNRDKDGFFEKNNIRMGDERHGAF